MNPYVATVKPNDAKPGSLARLRPLQRVLANGLRKACPPGTKVVAHEGPGALLLVTTGSRAFTSAEREAATAALRATCARVLPHGFAEVDGYTPDNLPSDAR